MTENALKCKYNGSAVPYGYMIDEDKHYQINPATAPVALEIFTRYAGAETATSIINDLNSRGLKNNKGKDFNKNSFHNMVKNRTYIGEYHYSDVIIPGGVPAIIPEDIFERAVARMEKELEAEEERLQASIRDERVSHPKITENHIRCMFDKYRDMDMSIPANRERLIDRLVGSILLYDDGKIVITFYYKDEPFVGMLEEISSASDKVGSDTTALGSPIRKHRSTASVLSYCYP